MPSGNRSAGSDCQTRSVSSPASRSVANSSGAPRPPSLSCTPVTPTAAAAGSAARIAASASARLASAWVSKNRHADSSRRIPVGSPPGSFSTTPPGTASSSATSSAAELTHSEWPSCARSAIFTPGAIASSAWRVGLSAHSSSRQPRPRSQPPGGTCAGATRSSASASERQPNRRSSRRASAQLGKCTCESTSPGSTQPPPRSIRRAPAGASAGSSSTAAIRSPSSTSAAASGRAGSSVRTTPPVRTLRCAAVPGSTVCLTFDFDALSVWFGYEHVTPAMLQRGEYGARVGVPRLLERLGALELPATFFIPGHTIESFGRECEAIVGAGHEGAHPAGAPAAPSRQSPAEERADMERALGALERLGVRPLGYRSPSADMSPATLPLLEEHGFLYDSSLMGDDYRPYRPRIGDEVSRQEPLRRGREADLWELPMSFELDD